MPTLFRLTMRSLAGPMAVTLALLCAAGLLLQVAGLLLSAAVAPDPGTTLRICWTLLPAVLEYALPVAFLVGTTVAYGRWAEEGTWLALRASGLGGRHLLPSALIAGLIVTLIMAVTSHRLAPMGRRATARALASSHEHVQLLPGHFQELGGMMLHRLEGGGLVVAHGETVMVARQGTLEPREGGLALRLQQGRALGADQGGPALSFDEAVMPLPLGSQGRRVELAERSDAELNVLISRLTHRGKDASYQQALLLERTTQPLAALLLPLICLPLGLRWGGKPGHAMGVVIVYWALIRIADASCSAIGAGPAAVLPLAGLTVACVLAWTGWRDR